MNRACRQAGYFIIFLLFFLEEADDRFSFNLVAE
jgi:hypothetical protein